jgi:hypothetical protein
MDNRQSDRNKDIKDPKSRQSQAAPSTSEKVTIGSAAVAAALLYVKRP